MSDSLDRRIRQIMSGHTRGIGATLARAALSCVEPIYTAIVGTRNHLFDRELMSISELPRPVISVGNLTTGGTGKTPVVQWIVRELQSMSHRPAVLLRGYKRSDTQASSDEEQLLRDSLGVPVFADPKRVLAGQKALRAHPEIDAFVLDDGFQHRQLARDLDVVLIDATNPFGYDHVLPRGMLRESLNGLARVDVVVLTRTDLAPPGQVQEIERSVRSVNAAVPILRSTHRMDDVSISATNEAATPESSVARRSLSSLRGHRVWAFCGIGNPDAFESGLRQSGVDLVGMTRFGDHHPYDVADVERLQSAAASAGGSLLVTTEKDMVKLRELPGLLSSVPIASVGVRIEMSEADAITLRKMLRTVMTEWQQNRATK